MRSSFSNPGTEKPNTDRQITIVGKEAVDAVNEKLNLNLGPGALGENLLTEGLGDLSQIVPHTVALIGKPGKGWAVELRVVKQNQPCKNLVHYHPEFNKEIHGRRGLLCAVVRGIGFHLAPGDFITMVAPVCKKCRAEMGQRSSVWYCRRCGEPLTT